MTVLTSHQHLAVFSVLIMALLVGMMEKAMAPLRYLCLQNPRDGGACWAAVYGVAQCQTRLMQLSSSSGDEMELHCGFFVFGYPVF